MAACLVCTVESLGNYQVAAVASQEPPPPSSAINRGMLIEGIGVMLAGLLGVGVGVTTYSANSALLSMTRIASRITLIAASIIMLFMGIFNKFGALLGTIPTPIIGAQFAVSMALVAGVAFSVLKEINLKSTRNINILGFAIIMGMLVPTRKKIGKIFIGTNDVDTLLNVVLNIQMLVGGLIAFILDNTIPGATLEERGLATRQEDVQNSTKTDECFTDGYALPVFVNRLLDKFHWLSLSTIVFMKANSG